LLGAFNKSDEKEYLYDMATYYGRTQDMMLATQNMFLAELGMLRAP